MKKVTILLSLFGLLWSQTPVAIPDTLSGTTFYMTIQNSTYQFYPGIVSESMGVNGPVLGPTLIMNRGDFVSLFLDNQLGQETTMHWHGMHVSAENDGGPHTVIGIDEIWTPAFTVLDKAGTYWYHPHLHENTNLQVSKGIAGFIIVRDAEEAALNLPRTYGIDDFPLVIQTKTIDASGQIIIPSNADSVLMVNATINPGLAVPAQVVRLRLLNGSSQRVFNLGLTGNQEFSLIASDGGLLENPVSLTRLWLAPGERAEILVDFSQVSGSSVSLRSFASEFPNGIYGAAQPGMSAMQTLDGYDPNPLNGNDFDIILFQIQPPTTNPVTSIPATLVSIEPYLESMADTTRTFTLDPVSMGQNVLNGDFLINDTYFNMDIINEIIPLNNTEIWSITNQSPIAHPFHIHDIQFYILDRNGVPPELPEQGRKDVVLVKPQETVRFITRFEDFTSDSVPYMYHCHMLTHEDTGMMGQFIVVDEATVAVDDNTYTPSQFHLDQAYPNPFNPATNIAYELSEPGLTTLIIYDLKGRSIKHLVRKSQSSGRYIVTWDGSDDSGAQVSGGMYFYQLHSGNTLATGKMIYLK